MSPVTGILIAMGAFTLSKVCTAFNGECRTALGMEAGRIPDSAISASSSYETKSVGPQNARIRQEKNGGAWCPKAQISSEIREYLEVDLVRNHLVTWTETQGRFGNGQGQEYTESFLVEYWRNSLNRWVIYKDTKDRQILKGNSNTYLVVRQELELPFVASKVRFIPYSEHPRTVCMRVEIYGCTWEQNIISYTAPRAESQSLDRKLEDLSYDGIIEDGVMKSGLGQLVDGIFGDEVFDPEDKGIQGTRWVGWMNETLSGQPLEITFEFDGPKEFSSVHVHVNNMFTRSIQVFSSALIFFSLDGEKYQPTPVRVNVKGDEMRESARNVTIPLHNRVGRFVRLQLTFGAHWLLISEVSFESTSIAGNMSEESLEKYFLQEISVPETASKVPGREITHARKEITPAKSPTSNTQAYIGLITGVLAVIVLLLACTILLMVRRGRKKVALLHKHTALVSSSTKPGVTINMKDLKMNMALSTPIINNGLTRSRLATKSKSNGKINNCKSNGDVYRNTVTGEESDSENSSVYHEPYKLLPSAKQEYGCLLKKDALSSSKSGEYTDFTSVNSFQDEVKFSSSFYNLAPPPPPSSRPPPYEVGTFQTPTKAQQASIPSENYYAATDIVKSPVPAPFIQDRIGHGFLSSDLTNSMATTFSPNTSSPDYIGKSPDDRALKRITTEDTRTTERREQNFIPGKLTPIKIPEGSAPEDSKILEFPRHRLRVIEKLGEGAFGMVHLCEAEGVVDYNGVSSFHKKQLVVVKSLWRGANENTKQDFLRESSWLASLRDANLSRVIGVCTTEEPLYVLQEYSDLGELPQFLRLQNSSGDEENNGVNYGCLIYIATQIASGMKYLESLELIHRDLSARNCIIGKNYSVKVSDHAMYCTRYENDYYLVDTKARLPIRWMAWENLLLGKQTSKSDVWSFAVTLWEILMYCNQQPFAELTNEQVVENSNHWYQNDGLARYLPRPPPCPREIYDLMGECWKRQATDRPRFSEIHLFLQRKNLGYSPMSG